MKSVMTWASSGVFALLSTSVLAGPIANSDAAVEQSTGLTYQGCYSSSEGLTYNSTYTWQTQSYCLTSCGDSAVEGLTSGLNCWCGNSVPPSSSKVSDSFCNHVCGGFGQSMCGSGDGKYFSIYLTGVGDLETSGSVSSPSSSAPSATSSSSNSVQSSSTTSASPSVVTVGGQTIVVTASSTSTPSHNSHSGGSGSSKAGIAAGVVVGVVAIAAIAGGLYFYIRHKRRAAVEEEYRRNAAVSTFINNGKQTMTDNRLDPVIAHRRLSDGSIADNEDYSRRILKVTNA